MFVGPASRLRRITNGQTWIPQIDGLRFLALAGVLLFHLIGEVAVRSGRVIPIEHRYLAMNLVLGNADRGVRLFFVISGFVLALPFARHFLRQARPVSIGKYYLRRLTRLEPPFIVSTLLLTLLVGTYLHDWTADLYRHSLATLFYAHNFIYGDVSTINMVTWSLEVEVQFYLVAPVLMQLFSIRRKGLRRGILLLLILLSAPLATHVLIFPALAASLLRYIGYFLAGLLTADIFVTESPLDRQHSRFDLAAAACLIASLVLPHDNEWTHAVLPLLLAGLCLFVMSGPIFSRILSKPAIAVIGGMCYSIYLLHMTIIAAVFKLSRHLIIPRADFLVNYLLQCCILIPCVLASSAVFFVLIERPCMDPAWPAKAMLWLKHRRVGAIRS